MTERRERDEEYYEAMPGTMQGTRYRREREVADAEAPARVGVLAWIGLAAVILLGLLTLGAINANRSKQPSTPGANGASSTGAQNYSGPQPAKNSGGAQMP